MDNDPDTLQDVQSVPSTPPPQPKDDAWKNLKLNPEDMPPSDPPPSLWNTFISAGEEGLTHGGKAVASGIAQHELGAAETGGVAEEGQEPQGAQVSRGLFNRSLQILAGQKADEEQKARATPDDRFSKIAAWFGGEAGSLFAPESVALAAVGGPLFGKIGGFAAGALAKTGATKTVTAGAEIMGSNLTLGDLMTHAATDAGTFGAFAATQNALEQGLDIESNRQAGMDYQALLLNTAFGMGLGATMPGIATVIKGALGLLPGQVERAAQMAIGKEVAANPTPEGISPAEAAAQRNSAAIVTKAQEEIPTAGTLPAPEPAAVPRLVVAQKMPDGSIAYGAPGELHSDLADRVGAPPLGSAAYGESMGFAEPGGKFLTRDEALKFVEEHEPPRAEHGIYNDYLEANHYFNGNSHDQAAATVRAMTPEEEAAPPIMQDRGGYKMTPEQAAHFDRYANTPEKQRAALARFGDAEHVNRVREAMQIDPIEENSIYVGRAARLLETGKETDPVNAYTRAVDESLAEQAHLHDINADELLRGTGLDHPEVEEDTYEIPFEHPTETGAGGPIPGEGAGFGEGAAENRGSAETERTAAGDQGLIPGVRPITDRERLTAEGGRPLTGGNAPPPAGGLFDDNARFQEEMFLRRGYPPNRTVGANELRTQLHRPELPGEAATLTGPRAAVTDRESINMNRDTAMKSIAQQLERKLEVDRHIKPGTLGTYKPKEGVLRIRSSGDIEVFAHELGHAIDHELSSDPATKAAWRGLPTAGANELLPLDLNAIAAGAAPDIREGTAEFLRRFITNPANARAVAPNTYDAFLGLLRVQPRIANILRDAAQLSQVDSSFTPMQTFMAMVAVKPNTIFQRMKATLSKNGIRATLTDLGHSIYAKTIAETHDSARFVEALRDARFKATGTPEANLFIKENPQRLIERLSGAQQAVTASIREGVRSYNDPFSPPKGPSLQASLSKAMNGAVSKIMNKQDPMGQAFKAYLIARRAKGEWIKYDAGELKNQPVNASTWKTLQVITDFETKYPQFKEAADGVFDFMRQSFQKQVDAGIVPQSLSDWVFKNGGDYIPFYRDFEGEMAQAGGKGGGKSLEFSPYMAFHGSTRDIEDPIESILRSVSTGERMIAMNDVWRSIDNLAQQGQEFAGQFWERVPNEQIKGQTFDLAEAIKKRFKEAGLSAQEAEMAIRDMEVTIGDEVGQSTILRPQAISPGGERIVFFYNGGERVAAKLGENDISDKVYKLMSGMSAPERDIFGKALIATNSMFQSFIVHSMRFLTGTVVRDNMTRIFIPRHMGVLGRLPFAQDIAGVHALLFDRAFFKSFAAYGGIRGGVASSSMRELYGEHPMRTLAPDNLLSGFMHLVETGETISRVGVAKMTRNYLLKQGVAKDEAMMGALQESTDVLNYSRRGSGLRGTMRLVPFLNAGIQGADRSARGLVAEPTMAAFKAYQRGGWSMLDASDKATLSAAWKNWTTISIASGAGVIYYNYVKDSDFYRNAPEYIKKNYWLIPTGHDADGHPTGFTIHKPYDLPGAVINLFENYAREVRKSDPVNWWKVFGAMESALPREFGSLNALLGAAPAIKTPYELATGQKLGFDSHDGPHPIIPEHYKALPPDQQVDATSSWIAIKIGHLLGESPFLVDHALDSFGATGGQDVRDISDSIFGENPLKDPKQAFARFFYGQIYRTQLGAPGVVGDIRNLMAQGQGKYAQQAAGYKTFLADGDVQSAQQIYNSSDDAGKTWMTLSSHAEFKPQDRMMHPLARSQAIAEIMSSMQRDLKDSAIRVTSFRTKAGTEQPKIPLSTSEARALSGQMENMLTEEVKNGLAIAKVSGYEDFPVNDTSGRIAAIREINPDVADELDRRLAKAKIVPAPAIEAAWPKVSALLLSNQQKAHLGSLEAHAHAHGWLK